MLSDFVVSSGVQEVGTNLVGGLVLDAALSAARNTQNTLDGYTYMPSTTGETGTYYEGSTTDDWGARDKNQEHGLRDDEGARAIVMHDALMEEGRLTIAVMESTVMLSEGGTPKKTGVPVWFKRVDEAADDVSRAGVISGTRGLRHSFDSHAAQWFGGTPTVLKHLSKWEELIKRAAKSKHSFDWKTGSSETVAHLAKIDGKYFMVQFFKNGSRKGELATAFVPDQKQLNQIFKILK